MLQIVSQSAHKHKSAGATLARASRTRPRKPPTAKSHPKGKGREERRREHEFPRTSPKTHKFHKVAIQSINSDRGWPLDWTVPAWPWLGPCLGHCSRYAHVHNHTTQTDFPTGPEKCGKKERKTKAVRCASVKKQRLRSPPSRGEESIHTLFFCRPILAAPVQSVSSTSWQFKYFLMAFRVELSSVHPNSQLTLLSTITTPFCNHLLAFSS